MTWRDATRVDSPYEEEFDDGSADRWRHRPRSMWRTLRRIYEAPLMGYPTEDWRPGRTPS